MIQAPASPSNFSTRPPSVTPSAVVYHDTIGTAESAIAWFQNPAAGVSAHYIVARDGRIFRCVEEAFKAWHAGSSVFHGVADVNGFSVGIELEDWKDIGDPYPAAQLASLIDLAAEISTRWRIPLNHHVGHCHIATPRGRKTDPGPDFPWYDYLNALGARLIA